MTDRLAFSLEVLRDEINKKAPNRSKRSDGWIGDKAHRARKSDHNPNSLGVVNAVDITHDPLGGCDAYQLARDLVANPDPRLAYVISNSKIASKDKGWRWRKYSGKNPHSKHTHISVLQDRAHYDSMAPWHVEPKHGFVDPSPVVVNHRMTLSFGSNGQDVAYLQQKLGIVSDGDFGPKTEKAVRAFQKLNKIVPDGIVGPYTWEKLEQ